MAKYAMFINPNKCTGCNACRIACQMQWSLPPQLNFNWLEEHVEGKYPNMQRVIVPAQCKHCDNPPCEAICPTHATYKREDGIVLVDQERCIGCKYCISACPYDARVINEQGLAEKCSFCAIHIANGEQPACVSTCMCGVRIFGDTEDPSSEIAKAIASHQTVKIEGTSMYYVLPENMGESVLPPSLSSPVHVGLFKDIVQPVSKGIMGLAATAVVGAVVVNTVRGGKKDE